MATLPQLLEEDISEINRALLQALMHSLEMLQRLQKHRGLGGQDSAAARAQCRLLADELDRLWRELPPAAGELEELHPAWQRLRSQADDFDGHCRLIEQLLTAMQLFELRQGEDIEIARRCRELEELARLRGLAVRGAGAPRCPLPLRRPAPSIPVIPPGCSPPPRWCSS